ncbi:MAG TPA: type I methionyl aminopeptidase [Chloroflexi bacterium]|nr:type I methionyl aminopeptidase [Chloroflexota bacterium]
MVTTRTPEELERMRGAGAIVARVLAETSAAVRPGITTEELDRIAARIIRSMGGTPSFLGYHGYPATICTSVNEEIVHGIPGKRVLREGDVISIDAGAIWQGYQGDAAVTVAVGQVSPEAERLMQVTRQALEAGIAAARAGQRLGDVSHAIEMVARAAGFEVVREYGGHGIGRAMHEEPRILNWGPPGRGLRLRPGMTLALEPMLTLGDYRTRQLDDGWTVITADLSLAAHFEHTIAITENGAEVLTTAQH